MKEALKRYLILAPELNLSDIVVLEMIKSERRAMDSCTSPERPYIFSCDDSKYYKITGISLVRKMTNDTPRWFKPNSAETTIEQIVSRSIKKMKRLGIIIEMDTQKSRHWNDPVPIRIAKEFDDD